MTVAMELDWQIYSSTSASAIKKSSSANGSSSNSNGSKHVWSEDPQKILSLMMGKPSDDRVAASSFQQHPEVVLLDQGMPLPSGWEKRLDLKSGSVSFVNCSTGMSTINDPRVLGWLSPNTTFNLVHSQMGSSVLEPADHDKTSPKPTLLEAAEEVQLDLELNLGRRGRSASPSLNHRSKRQDCLDPIAVTGCKSCLMYVMLSPKNPQCPKCGSYVVLDIPQVPLPKKSRP